MGFGPAADGISPIRSGPGVEVRVSDGCGTVVSEGIGVGEEDEDREGWIVGERMDGDGGGDRAFEGEEVGEAPAFKVGEPEIACVRTGGPP
jgi:hypothetical protein